MIGPSGPPGPDVSLRDQLSALQGLLALSMLMTESDNEHQIVHLATTSVSSLGRARVEGVYLLGEGWRMTAGACDGPDVQADLESQFTVLSAAGGVVAIMGQAWGWAFSLRSIEGHYGYLVVAADEEPPSAEQFLLRVLAQQTGVALAKARLHGKERATAKSLRATNEVLASTVAALERSTAIHECLTRAAMAQEGQEGIARALHDLTGFPVAIEDGHGNVRAWAGPDRPDPYPKHSGAGREELLRRATDEGRPVRDGDRLVVVARPREAVVGVLALIDPEQRAGEQERVALEHGATVLAVELARLQELAEIERRLGRDLVDELLAGPAAADEERTLSRAQGLGYDLERPHRVVVVESEGRGGDDDVFFHAVRRAARDCEMGSLLVGRADAMVLLSDAVPSPGSSPESLAAAWERLRTTVIAQLGGGECRLGVGGVCDRVADFARSYREAALALRVQHAADLPDQATTFSELGVYRLLADVEQPTSVERFVDEWLGALLAYDVKKGSDLVVTLSRYLACGKNYDATAKALAVHRSTLKYRLQRISEISGHDLSNADTQFNLQLATRAWQTVRALRGEGSA
jgi:DNA-binding PucR family transcriptional regulator